MKQVKQFIAKVLLFVLILQLVPGLSPVLPVAVEAAVPDGFLTAEMAGNGINGQGVWITEIYNNDTDRSTTNNTRETNGYESINLFDSTSDLMEFVEIVSTYDDDIKFNDLYQLSYTSPAGNVYNLTVTTVDGSADVTLTKGQPVVLWNYRTDVTATLPTEAQFRKDMRVPDNALVLKITSGVGWDSNSTMTLTSKSTGKVVCTFTTVNGAEANVLDGFSVELKLPLMGSNMEVYRNLTLPSPGYVYPSQVRGLIVGNTSFDGKGVYVTEIRPNDVSRKSTYGSSSDFMECLEVVNTTDAAIDLNTQYNVVYATKEGHRKVLELHKYSSSATNYLGSTSGCTVPAGGTAVLWCFRYTGITDYTSFPTLTQFRNAYGISSSTPVYIFANQNSFNNSNRALEVFKVENGGLGQLISTYSYIGASDVPDNTSVHLAINPDGPEMLINAAATASTMGTVSAAQLNYVTDYGDAIHMHLADGNTVPTSIMQGQEIRVNFWYDFNSRTPRTATNTYYRLDGTGDWIQSAFGGIRVPNTYESIISAYDLFDHDYVEFYVVNENSIRQTVTDIYKVDIVGLNEVSGIRTNITDGESVSGTVSITANDGGTNSATKIYIDGKQYTTKAMMEDGAYFTFTTDGVDAYFKNVITTTNNELVHAFGQWLTINLSSQVVHVDNSLFTSSSSAYKVTLRFWAGTLGTSVDEYLTPSANREDFKVSNLQLKLPNGNTYLPSAIGPSSYGGVDTSAKTNLSTALDAVHSIGDSSKMCPYMDVTFSVPTSAVNAVGVSVDTTKLSDGQHTLKVTNGTSTQEVTFVVDNTAPTVNMGFTNGASLSKNITIWPKANENVTEFVTTLNGEVITLPYETTARTLGEGTHTVTVYAKDIAGNVTETTSTFLVEDISMALTDAGSKDITGTTAQLYLTAQSGVGGTATFYKAEKIDTANIETSTGDGILPYIQYTLDVGNAGAGDNIVVNWNGTASGTDDTHASTLYAKNAATGAWDPIATVDGTGSIKNAVISAADYATDGKVTVIVQCTADSALPDLDTVNDGKTGNNTGWDGMSVPNDYDFSFAWISDTQGYVQRYQSHFLQMNQWIVDNRDAWKIKYVMHTGDIVDDWDATYMWENADAAMKIFDDAGMPYGVLGGNHDVASGLDLREYYYAYFGEDRVKDQPTFGGSYKNNLGHYDLVSENGQDFIIVYMSWNIYQEEIDWMNKVLAEHSDRKAILCFHAYTHVNTSVDGLLDYFGVMIRDHVVAKNPNVFAVLNGHYSGSTYQTVRFDDNGDGKKDRTVYQICTDYQSVEKGGLQYVKFLYFDLDNDKIFVNSYSPYMDDFNYFDTTAPDDLSALAKASSTGVVNNVNIDSVIMSVDFSVAEQSILENSFSAYVYTDEVLTSGSFSATTGRAEAKAAGLTPDTDYTWYATIENDNGGYLLSDAYTMTTTHNYQGVVTAPTCTAQGYTTYTCTGCGDSYQGDIVAAAGHSYQDTVTPPTCTENGYTTHRCTVCGDTTTDTYVPITGHSYNVVTTAPGCTDSGYTTYTCRVCGDSYISNVVEPTGHSYSAAVTKPTCTAQGFTTYTCTGCGHSYTGNTVAATGHRYTGVTTDATCTAAGKTVYTCTGCGDSYTETIAALGHSYSSKTTAATCTADGKTVYTCGTCGDSYTETISATGHNYVGGTCQSCGEAEPSTVIKPTMTVTGTSLSFEDEIFYNIYYTVDDASSVVEMGLVTFTEKLADGTHANAVDVIPGYVSGGGEYMVHTNGIPAKNMGDAVYFRIYAKLTDGSYVYGNVAGYHAVAYAKSILAKSTNANMKALVVAMVNYGAEAQLYFGYNTDSLMNSFLTAEQQALVSAYDSSMIASVVSADSAKTAAFPKTTGAFSVSTSVSFDGAFSVNYYFTPGFDIDGDMTLYYWDAATYASADALTKDNATSVMTMTLAGSEYWGVVAGIAAKEIDQTIYVAAVYESNGVEYTSGVTAYSLGHYCKTQAAKETSAMKDFAAATGVYGYYAKQYFASIA